MIQVNWSDFKSVSETRNLSIQWVDANGNYYIKGFDGLFVLDCILNKAVNLEEVADFEANFKPTGNQSPRSEVVTQFEKNDKDLKLARGQSAIDPLTKTAVVYVKVPGTFGVTGQGRYVAGGDGFLDSFDWGDYATVTVEDKDRLLAAVYGDAASLGRPMTDEEMQAASPYPAYPIVKSYTDDELAADGKSGWYFWPEPLISGVSAFGCVEVEPIGGYGFVPAGMYLKIVATRANLTTGTFYCNVYWGKLE